MRAFFKSKYMHKSLAYFFVLNLSFYIVTYLLGLERVLINFDYLWVLGLIALNFKKSANLVFIVVFLSDVLLIIGQIFPFSRLIDIIYISKFIWVSATYYQILFIALSLILVFLIFVHFKINVEKKPWQILFIGMAILFIGETIYLQNSHHVQQKMEFSEHSLIDSLTKHFIFLQFKGMKQAAREQQTQVVSIKPTATKLDLEQRLLSNEKPQAVLFILDESLGAPKDNAVLNAMLSPLVKQKAILKDWHLSKIVYTGATVQAELRELCQVQAQNFNLQHLEQGFEYCLPHYFNEQGYTTTAVHGALGLMYDRKYWYPRAGFQNLVFRDTQQWKTRCYSFPGVCDREVAERISDIFKQSPKSFVYWLTLNTHTNYDLRDVEKDLFDCQKYGIASSSEVCRNLKLQTQFFDTLANLIQQPHMDGVEVFLVGDHTPSIINRNDKQAYFDGDHVLSLKFVINQD